MAQHPNLNTAPINGAHSMSCATHRDGKLHALMPRGPIGVAFNDHEELLCTMIRASSAVIGCTAWLTNPKILDALQGRPVHMIVQKEKWVRDDAELRARYSALKGFIRPSCGPCQRYIDARHGGVLPAVMCAGVAGSGVRPNMHHKFFVFGETTGDVNKPFKALSVWSGSFNPTRNATQSLESGIYVSDERFAGEFGQEFVSILQIMAEPLDWTSEDVTPWTKTAHTGEH